ncbi:MAG TPA: purine-nucleoside phosphorylase [Firmicutes bacterium]|nr:purine-nucleoside phosphorylase [Bacillota bacterium]
MVRMKLWEYRESADYIQKRAGIVGETAVVLGSGFGILSDELEDSRDAACTEIPYSEIPHFPVSTNPSHAGRLLFKQINGRQILLLSGRFHYYEGYSAEQVAYYVRVLHLLGIKNLVLTNAAGGIGEHLQVGDLVLIRDHIKLCAQSPAIGSHFPAFGERFFDMTDTYSTHLREIAKNCARQMGYDLKEGVYAFMAGPQYETPAEIRALKILGADLVGMSTVFEAIAARQCRMNLLGLSCVTNLAAGIASGELADGEVIEQASQIANTAKELLTRILCHLKP